MQILLKTNNFLFSKLVYNSVNILNNYLLSLNLITI